MLKQILSATKVVLLALILSFGLSYALAWTSPTATPPGANVAAPLNVGSSAQEKFGPLTVSSLTTAGAVTAGSVSTTGLTNTGTLRVTGGAPGLSKVLTSDASGNATWQTPSTGADNLGNHTATQNLSLGANNIIATGADTTFGGITLQADKNGYGGINFKNTAGTTNYATVMANAANAGFYNAAHNGWLWYVNNTGDSTQAGAVYASDVYSATSGKWMSALQSRVSGTCAVGSAVRVVNANGTVTCGNFDDSQIGIGQTWQLPTRSVAVTYTNNTAKPIMVVKTHSVNEGSIAFYVNNVIVDCFNSSGGPSLNVSIGGIVPPGATYKVADPGLYGCSGTWKELR